MEQDEDTDTGLPKP